MLVAAQRAARRDALQAIDAALSARHAGSIAAIAGSFAAKRAGLVGLSGEARAAAMSRLSAEEAQETARLVLVFVSEKRAMKRSAALAMLPAQRKARRQLRQTLRRRRMALYVTVSARSQTPISPLQTRVVASGRRFEIRK